MKTQRLLSVLIPIAGAIAVASCSDTTHVAEVPDDSGAIRFAAQSPALSRSLTTTDNISEFSVYAYTEGKPFMEDVTVSKTATNTWEYSPVVYWPTTPVNFYSFSPTSWSDYKTGESTAASTTGPAFNPSEPVNYYGEYGNTDLIYAVNMQQTQSASPVVFNFRHALSQVLVDLRTDKSDVLDIQVSNVTVNGVKTNGAFTFPTESTVAGGTAQGVWSAETGSSQYIYFMPATQSELLTLTATAQQSNNVSQGFLLPQTLGTFTLEDSNASGNYASGDYISVDCIIYNKGTGNQVWPNDATPPAQNINDGGHLTGRLYFPLLTDNVTEWKQGVRYIYTITINEPAGLQQILFGAPTVDTYTEVTVNE